MRRKSHFSHFKDLQNGNDLPESFIIVRIETVKIACKTRMKSLHVNFTLLTSLVNGLLEQSDGTDQWNPLNRF